MLYSSFELVAFNAHTKTSNVAGWGNSSGECRPPAKGSERKSCFSGTLLGRGSKFIVYKCPRGMVFLAIMKSKSLIF